jgi:hypothetical protein
MMTGAARRRLPWLPAYFRDKFGGANVLPDRVLLVDTAVLPVLLIFDRSANQRRASRCYCLSYSKFFCTGSMRVNFGYVQGYVQFPPIWLECSMHGRIAYV